MKIIYLFRFTLPVFFMLFFLSKNGVAQDRVYTTSGMEMIFSFADLTIGTDDVSTNLRWTPFFNIHSYLHLDMSDNFGFFTGLAIRNVGLIYNDPDDNNLNIYRTYNLGIPAALKIGHFEKGFIYGGYEIEFPFHFKHKFWGAADRSGAKTKLTSFFSNRTNSVFHTWFAGIQFRGVNVKFKYYLNNFFNQNFTEDGIRIYDDYESNIFYFSITANMFRDQRLYYFYE